MLRQSSTKPKYNDDKENRNHTEAKQGRNKREEHSRHFDKWKAGLFINDGLAKGWQTRWYKYVCESNLEVKGIMAG